MREDGPCKTDRSAPKEERKDRAPSALPCPPGLPGFRFLPRGHAQGGGEGNRGARVPFVLPHQLAVALGLFAERAADAGAPPANAAEAEVSHLPLRHPDEVRLARRIIAVGIARDAVHAVAPVPLALLSEIGPLRFPGAPEYVHHHLPSVSSLARLSLCIPTPPS